MRLASTLILLFLLGVFSIPASVFGLDEIPIQYVYCTIDSQYLIQEEQCIGSQCSATLKPWETDPQKYELIYNDFIYTVKADGVTTQYTYGVGSSGFDFFPDDEFLNVLNLLCKEDADTLAEFSSNLPNNTAFEIDLRMKVEQGVLDTAVEAKSDSSSRSFLDTLKAFLLFPIKFVRGLTPT